MGYMEVKWACCTEVQHPVITLKVALLEGEELVHQAARSCILAQTLDC